MYQTPNRRGIGGGGSGNGTTSSYNNNNNHNNNNNNNNNSSPSKKTTITEGPIHDLCTLIESTPTDDWLKRITALESVIELIPALGSTYLHHPAWYNTPKVLLHLSYPIQELMKDPRSTVVRRVCVALTTLFHRCQSDARLLFKDMMHTVLIVQGQTVQTIRNAVTTMIVDSIPQVPCKSVMPFWMERLKDKSPAIRDACSLYLGIALQSWSSIEQENYLTDEIWYQVGTALIKTLRDPSPNVRQQTKTTLIYMQQQYPIRWETLIYDTNGPAAKDTKLLQWLKSLGNINGNDDTNIPDDLSFASKYTYNSESRFAGTTTITTTTTTTTGTTNNNNTTSHRSVTGTNTTTTNNNNNTTMNPPILRISSPRLLKLQTNRMMTSNNNNNSSNNNNNDTDVSSTSGRSLLIQQQQPPQQQQRGGIHATIPFSIAVTTTATPTATASSSSSTSNTRNNNNNNNNKNILPPDPPETKGSLRRVVTNTKHDVTTTATNTTTGSSITIPSTPVGRNSNGTPPRPKFNHIINKTPSTPQAQTYSALALQASQEEDDDDDEMGEDNKIRNLDDTNFEYSESQNSSNDPTAPNVVPVVSLPESPFIASMHELKKHASQRRSRNSLVMQERFKQQQQQPQQQPQVIVTPTSSRDSTTVETQKSEMENQQRHSNKDQDDVTTKLSSKMSTSSLLTTATTTPQQKETDGRITESSNKHTSLSSSNTTITQQPPPEHIVIAIRLLRAHKSHVDQIMETLKLEMDTLRDFDRLLELPGRPTEEELITYYESIDLCVQQRYNANLTLRNEMNQLSTGGGTE